VIARRSAPFQERRNRSCVAACGKDPIGEQWTACPYLRRRKQHNENHKIFHPHRILVRALYVIRLRPSAMERRAGIGSHRKEIRCREARPEISTRPCLQSVEHRHDHRYQGRETGQEIVRRRIHDRVQGLSQRLQSDLEEFSSEDRQP